MKIKDTLNCKWEFNDPLIVQNVTFLQINKKRKKKRKVILITSAHAHRVQTIKP